LGNDIIENIATDPYVHPKPVARLTPDGREIEIVGYPLHDTGEAGPALWGAGSISRIAGLIDLSLSRWRRPQPAGFVDYGLPYQSDRVEAGAQDLLAPLFKINEIILGDIRKRVDAAIGPGHLAVLLVPTKFEYGLSRKILEIAEPNAVADRVVASLNQLGI